MNKIIFTLLLLPSLVWADISSDMQSTAHTLSQLLTLSVQPKVFEQKNEQIVGLLEKLNTSLKKNEKHFKGKSPHIEMNQVILTRLNLQALKSYQLKRYEVSRQLIQAAPNVCLSCHQNDKIKSESFSRQIPSGLSLSEQAQFAMATRQPDLALKLLDESLMKNKMSKSHVENVLRKKLQLTLSQKTIGETKEMVTQEMKKQGAKKDHVKLLLGWLKGLDQTEKFLSKDLTSINDVPRLLKAAYGSEDPSLGLLANPQDEVFFLTLKNQISTLMNEMKHKDLPEAYYWMALCERAVGYELYYSMADSYLVTCVEKWSTQPIAKKCFKEYESFIEFAYSGSSGTHIPKDVQEELKVLGEKLKP